MSMDEGGAEVAVPKLLVLAGLASSAGEATRKLAENAVSIERREVFGQGRWKRAIGGMGRRCGWGRRVCGWSGL